MKKFTVITGLQMFTDVVDGPGWTDVEVDGYYDSNGKYLPPQYYCSSPKSKESVHTVTSK